MTTIKKIFVASFFAISMATVNAGVVVYLNELGGDVVGSSSGTIDLNAFGSTSASGSGIPGIMTSDLFLFVTPSPTGQDYVAGTGVPSGPWGSGASSLVDVSAGDWFGFAPSYITLPTGYVSGSPIANTFSFTGTDFATLGLNPGSYLQTYSTGPFFETVTLNIGIAPPGGGGGSPIPEPGTFAILGLLVAASTVARRRKGRA